MIFFIQKIFYILSFSFFLSIFSSNIELCSFLKNFIQISEFYTKQGIYALDKRIKTDNNFIKNNLKNKKNKIKNDKKSIIKKITNMSKRIKLKARIKKDRAIKMFYNLFNNFESAKKIVNTIFFTFYSGLIDEINFNNYVINQNNFITYKLGTLQYSNSKACKEVVKGSDYDAQQLDNTIAPTENKLANTEENLIAANTYPIEDNTFNNENGVSFQPEDFIATTGINLYITFAPTLITTLSTSIETGAEIAAGAEVALDVLGFIAAF